jgi:glycosyl hydrolase family 38
MRTSIILPVCVIAVLLRSEVLDHCHLARGETAETEAAADRPQLKRIVVVFKTHFDIGYTALASEVVERYQTSMIDKALAVCDHAAELPAEHRFAWTVPGWPMSKILWPGQTPERRTRLDRAIAEGRLVWHALPGTTHTESLDLEDFVRGMGFSSRLSRQYGMPLVRDAKMTDVPSHCWILPTILKHSGVDFLHLGCNSASGSPDVPLLFWWEGPDGSRVLTMYEASGYGSGLKPPDDWPHKTWLALIHTGDNHGPPTPEEVKKLLDQAAKEYPGVKIQMGRLSDFGDAILAENPDLPVVRADMPDTWIHGIMSMPRETKTARNIRPRIGALEALNTLLACWKTDVAGVDKAVAGAYEGSLMYGEHTWGYSMSPFGYHYGKEWADLRAKGHYARMEQSWGEHGAYINQAERLVTPALAENMAALARGLKIAGPRIVVFNPLPWTRDDVVSVEVPDGTPYGLKDATTGDTVPTEIEATTLRFVARDVPAMGYRTYVAAKADKDQGDLAGDADSATIENHTFCLKFDPSRGVVTSLVDKRSGRELVDKTSKYGFGQYLYERFDEENIRAFFKAYLKYQPGWNAHFGRGKMPPATEVAYSATSPKDFTLDVHRSDVSITATMTAKTSEDGTGTVSLSTTLYRNQPYVDFEWIVADKKPDPWPEAGWLCFPLLEKKPSFRLGRLGSLVNPAEDARRSSNFEVFCLTSGMTVSGPGGVGVGLCPIDSPLVSIGRPGVYKYSREFGARDPVLFVNLFNNAWGTNFQQWTDGSWSSRVRLWSIEGEGSEAELVTPGWEARSGCQTAFFDGPAGKLPLSLAGLQLSRKGVLLTAFGSNPDGDGTLLRLWEQVGRDGICRVRLPDGMNATWAQPCDLRGRASGDPIEIRDGTFDVPLTHFAPASYFLQ